MTVPTTRRRLHTCTAPAGQRITMPHPGRPAGRDYTVHTCAGHRDRLRPAWQGDVLAAAPAEPCGTVDDYRPGGLVVESHADLWLRALALDDPDADAVLEGLLEHARGALILLRRQGWSVAHETLLVALQRTSTELAVGGDVLGALAAAETAHARTRGILAPR